MSTPEQLGSKLDRDPLSPARLAEIRQQLAFILPAVGQTQLVTRAAIDDLLREVERLTAQLVWFQKRTTWYQGQLDELKAQIAAIQRDRDAAQHQANEEYLARVQAEQDSKGWLETLHQKAREQDAAYETELAAVQQELAHWKICENCGEPLEGPGICGRAISEREKGLEAMHEETLTRAESAEQEKERLRQTLATLVQGHPTCSACSRPQLEHEGFRVVCYPCWDKQQAELTALRAQQGRLRAFVVAWRDKGAATDTFHATMGIGWKACADDLAIALDAPEPQP